VIWQFSTEPYFQQPLRRKGSAPRRAGRWAAVSSSHPAPHPIHPAAFGPARPDSQCADPRKVGFSAPTQSHKLWVSGQAMRGLMIHGTL
jgi:hypothetical protein